MDAKTKVTVSTISPLVMDLNGRYSGFETELWDQIAQESGIDFEYEPVEFQQIITNLVAKKADISLGGITINEEREKQIDFSYPILDSGLAIMISRGGNKISVWNSIKYLFIEGHQMLTRILLGVFGFIFIMGNLLWLAELNANTFSNNYFPGILESFWLVICSMSTDSFGDYVPHTWAGRFLIMIIIIGGVAIFGILIAQVTTFLTLKRIRGNINNYKDLAGKTVATKKNTTSVKALGKVGAKIVKVDDIEQAYEKLAHKQVDAVVFDSPTLIYLAETPELNKDRFEMVEGLFYQQKYGIALQQNSPLREPINRALLKLRESGVYDQLYKKWFGEEAEME